MNTKKYCVYSHINKINDKIYIGLTSMIPEERWKNGMGYHIGTHFRYAINKYGWDNFEHKILKDNLTKDEASYWEKYYINLYNSTNRKYGYNISSGGEYGGHTQTIETRRKISSNGYHQGMKGKKHSEITKYKMSKSRTGKKFSNESKNKMKLSALKNRGRLFLCVELNQVFDNLNDAYDVTTCPKSAIVLCCQGKQKQSKGYHWKYVTGIYSSNKS